VAERVVEGLDRAAGGSGPSEITRSSSWLASSGKQAVEAVLAAVDLQAAGQLQRRLDQAVGDQLLHRVGEPEREPQRVALGAACSASSISRPSPKISSA
jgi:hypothetical protein